MSMSVWLSYTDEKIPHLKSSHVGKKNNKKDSDHPWIIHLQSPPPLLGAVMMKTSGGPSQIRLTSSVNIRVVRTQWTLGLHSAGCVLREERRHWPLESTTWSWRRRVSWWSTWCRPLHPLPPLLRSCPQSAARTLCSRSYRPAWSIYTAACGNRGQDGRLVNSNKVSSFLLSGCRLQFWINFRPHNSKKDLKTHLRVFFQK